MIPAKTTSTKADDLKAKMKKKQEKLMKKMKNKGKNMLKEKSEK